MSRAGCEGLTSVANLQVIEDFASRLEVLPYLAMAAQHYGSIRCSLEKLGTPIGVNDLHIAAQARSQGLVVVTNNVSEFARVPGLLWRTGWNRYKTRGEHVQAVPIMRHLAWVQGNGPCHGENMKRLDI